MKFKIFILLFLLLFVVLPAEAQCAMCRAVLQNQDGGNAAKGVNNGIIYLMIFPYLLVGGVAFAIYKSRKKTKS